MSELHKSAHRWMHSCISHSRPPPYDQLWPYWEMLCVRRWSDAGPAGRVRWYNAESPKQGDKRFYSITKTIHFAYLGILFIYDSDLLLAAVSSFYMYVVPSGCIIYFPVCCSTDAILHRAYQYTLCVKFCFEVATMTEPWIQQLYCTIYVHGTVFNCL